MIELIKTISSQPKLPKFGNSSLLVIGRYKGKEREVRKKWALLHLMVVRHFGGLIDIDFTMPLPQVAIEPPRPFQAD